MPIATKTNASGPPPLHDAAASSSSIADEYEPLRAAEVQRARWWNAACAAGAFDSLPVQASSAPPWSARP